MTNKMNDEAFMILLASQRQLLNQMNMEKSGRRRMDQRQNAFPEAPQNKSISFMGDLNPTSLINKPIIERRGSIDFLLSSRRLSMGMGSGDICGRLTPNLFSEYDDPTLKANWGMGSMVAPKTMKGSGSKGNGSGLDLLSPMIMDDQQQVSRRLSLLSAFSMTNGFDEERIVGDDVFGEETSFHVDSSHHKSTELKNKMEAFAAAMERSSKSQLDIHNWDKKMGLKRSHSKTMRMSMRSRKKLRNLIKKEINAMR